jgi:tRNA pseudouridine38-40 synthase
MEALAGMWIGRHDFSAFGSATRPEGSTERTVLSAKWQNDVDEWTFEIQADAFLYRMVRRLVYVQVAVGQGRLQQESLVRALDGGSRPTRSKGVHTLQSIPANLAPANGLTLLEVRYDRLV